MAPLPLVEDVLCRLQRCRIDKDVQATKQIHMLLCENGLDFHAVLGNHLIPALVQCERLPEAQQAFDRLPHRREVSWTSLIHGYIELGEAENGLQIYERMHKTSVCPSMFTFSVMLKACAKLCCIDRGRTFHSMVVKNGLDDNLFIGNTLVDLYAKCGLLFESHEVFDVLTEPDLVSWNALITGYAENGFAGEALACFECLQSRGMSPDVTTFLGVLKACSTMQAEDQGKKVHAMIVKDEYEEDTFLGNTLVDMYAKCRLLEEAQETFEELPLKDIVSWNALITGHADCEHYDEVLCCWRDMQVMGILPNSGTFVRVCQACGGFKELGRGQEAHAEVVQRGMEDEYFVINTLVDMYSKLGLLEDAHYLFNNILGHDVVSWNALITGYPVLDIMKEGMSILGKMQQKKISPDLVTFSTFLRACSSIADLEKGREIHTEISKLGFENRFSGSSLLDLYVKCNSLQESQCIFDRLHDRDVVCWNVLIAGYSEQGLSGEALNCVQQMQHEGLCPDPGTYVCILQTCTISSGRELHFSTVQEECDGLLCVSSALINMYVKNGHLSEACEVFDKQVSRDVISWTALIGGYEESNQNDQALICFEQMLIEGVAPNQITFVRSLKACTFDNLDKGRELHAMIVGLGLERDSLIGNSLVGMYAGHGDLTEAMKMFYEILVRDVFSWTTLIAGLADHGKSKDALDGFEQMQEDGVSPDSSTYLCVLQACCSLKALNNAQGLYTGAVKQGVEQDPFIGNALVELYAKSGSLTDMQDIFDRLPTRDLVAWTTLIGGYVEQRFMEKALNCLFGMQRDGIMPDLVAWSSVISGFTDVSDYEKPLILCAQMQEQGLLPDGVILLNVINTCRNGRALDVGRRIHVQVRHLSNAESSSVPTKLALMDLYGKCGSLCDAEVLFQSISTRSFLAWNALLICYALLGESRAAFLLLEKMIEVGLHPDADSFLSVFIVCSHAGLWCEGQFFHQLMEESLGVMCTLKHLTCFVDLLARAGRLECAQCFLESIPFQPDLVLLHAMLSACRALGDVELANELFAIVKDLDRTHGAAYILMSNLFIEDYL